MKTSHPKAVSAYALISPFLTAARQLQIYTGFPFNSQDRNADATVCYYRLSRLRITILEIINNWTSTEQSLQSPRTFIFQDAS
ncbi:hypothetical protein D3C73_1459690 [compost metagenome]